MLNPRFITSNNTTQKFILFFSIPEWQETNKHQFTVACVRRSVALGPIWQILCKISDASGWLSQQNQQSNTQAQFVSYFTNRDASISENAGLNLAHLLLPFVALQHKHHHRHIDDRCESERTI